MGVIVESLPVEVLVLDPRNARKHDEKNLSAIAGSLDRFGQRKPIVVTSENVVVAGNGTLTAALSLGWEKIDVVRVPDDWSDDQVKAFALADNRTAELAVWDEQVMASQLLELDAAGFDIAEFGFEAVEPPKLEADETLDEVDFDNVISRASFGDHWVVGRHQIICGDSTEKGLLDRFGVTFDAVVTDPPYGIGAGSWKRLGKGKINNNAGKWDSDAPDISFVLDLAPTQIIWGGNYFTDILPPTNDWLCWHKKNDGRTFSEFELAWTNLGKQARILSHHWSGEEKQHITMKPSPVMDWCVSFLPKGANILDVYAGSGSTLLAAERNNQNGFAVELSPIYVDVILDRLEKLTGLKAELVS
jgi:site-specific DNA-methyltransferase (adenine-specific)